MLPSHLQGNRNDKDNDDSDDDDETSNHRLYRQRAPLGQQQQQQQQRYNSTCNQPLPLGLTGVLCDSNTLQIPNGRGTLHYTIFRPRSMTIGKPPLICIAGGPCIPCTYLAPLVHLITDRSIILYDHLGSGQSQLYGSRSSTTNNNCTTNSNSSSQDIVNDMVQDFTFLIQNIPWKNNNKTFHLYGHSFGGIIAYEYLRQQQQQQNSSTCSSCTKCQSLILSSTPVSIPQVLADTQALQTTIRQEIIMMQQGGRRRDDNEGPTASSSSTCATVRQKPSSGSDVNNATLADLHENDDDMQVAATFSQRHECRVRPIPLPLEQAWQMAAYAQSSTNRGLEKVQHYVATATTPTATTVTSTLQSDDSGKSAPLVPAALILRGQYDFVSMDCFTDWLPLLQPQQQSSPPQPPSHVQQQPEETPTFQPPAQPPKEQEEKEDGTTSGNQKKEEDESKEEDNDEVMAEAAAGDEKGNDQKDMVKEDNVSNNSVATDSCNDSNHAVAAPSPPNSTNSFTCEMVTLENCSHYGMFENEQLYKDTLNSFLQRHDPKSTSDYITLPNGVRVRR